MTNPDFRPIPWCPVCGEDGEYLDDDGDKCRCEGCGYRWTEDMEPGEPDYDAVTLDERHLEAWEQKRYG